MNKVILIIIFLSVSFLLKAQTYNSDVLVFKEGTSTEFNGVYSKTEIKINEDKGHIYLFLLDKEDGFRWRIDIIDKTEDENHITYRGLCEHDSTTIFKFNKSSNEFMLMVNGNFYAFKNIIKKGDLLIETYTSDRTTEGEGEKVIKKYFNKVEIDIDERRELIYISFFDLNVQWKFDILSLSKDNNGIKYSCKKVDNREFVIGYYEPENVFFIREKEKEASLVFEHIKVKK